METSTDNGTKFTMPYDFKAKFGGTTGLWKDAATNYPLRGQKPLGVITYLQSIEDYGGHDKDRWDCEDRALLGVSRVRCKFPGAPVGVAVRKEPNGEDHAVIIIWYKKTDTSPWEHTYFDPLRGEVEFNVHTIIPFPVWRPNADRGSRDELSEDFKDLQWLNKCAVVLDQFHNFDSFGDIKKSLELKEYGECQAPKDSSKALVFREYWSREDKALWAMIQTRFRLYKSTGNPIPLGIAFGTAKKGKYRGKDHAVLILWKNTDKFIFWDLVDGDIGIKFNARLVVI